MRKITILGICLLSLFISGCWDVSEIDRRSVVIAIGLDSAGEDKVKFTAEIPLVQNLLPPAIGGQSSQGKLSYIITSEAESAFNTTSGLQNKTERPLFDGQVQAVVISTGLAKRGLQPLTDFLERHPEIPPQAEIILTPGTAEALLSSNLTSKTMVATALDNFFESLKQDQTYTMKVWQFLHAIDTNPDEPEEAFLSLVAFEPKEQVLVFRGMGVFHGDKLAGELSGNEARMFGLLTGKARNTYLQVPSSKFGRLTYRGVKGGSKVKVTIHEGRFDFLIKVRAKGFLVEMTKSKADLSPQDIKFIQDSSAHALENEMTQTVHHLQELNSDILNLGELVRATHPRVWRRLDWNREFPKVSIRVEVKFQAERTGKFR
jgi:spore germination protein KC